MKEMKCRLIHHSLRLNQPHHDEEIELKSECLPIP